MTNLLQNLRNKNVREFANWNEAYEEVRDSNLNIRVYADYENEEIFTRVYASSESWEEFKNDNIICVAEYNINPDGPSVMSKSDLLLNAEANIEFAKRELELEERF